MTLSDISIKNPVFAWMLMIGLILFGAIGFSRMGISQMPDIDFPLVNIDVEYEGAAPEIMETDVIDVIEDAVISVEGVVEIRSIAQHGKATITVELELNRDVDVALQEIQSKLSQSQRLLPDDIEPPIISKRNPEDYSIIVVAVSSDKPMKDQMVYARHHLKDKFQTIPGVGEVRLYGYVDRNVRIWVDRNKLVRYDLTVDDIMNAIGREHVEVPGGRLETPRQELVIRSLGEAMSIESLGNIPITARGANPIYSSILLKDIATIEDGLDEVKRISRLNGKQAVGFGIMKQRGANAIAIAKGVIKRVEELKGTLPEGYQIGISHNWSRYIEESTNELLFTIILSTILTGLVCYFFLGSWSSTINILLAIPTSIVGTFIPLYFLGYTLNTFTLLALSLSIGIVVDDAIMVMENISRYMEQGEERVEASRRGARQITFAAIAATLAVVAIFLPVAFMSGIIGKFFLQFGVTITVAVLLSLLEALTLTPMRCSQFLVVGVREGYMSRMVNTIFQSLSGYYAAMLRWSLHNRLKIILISFGMFALSIMLVIPLKKEFVPEQDMSMFIVRLKTPVGSSMEFTNNMCLKVEKYLAGRKEVLHQYVAVGGFRGGESNSANIFVSMHDHDKRPVDKKKGRPLNQLEFSNELRKELRKISKDLKVSIQTTTLRGLTPTRGYPVEFNIKGDDWDKLGKLSLEIEKKMESSGKMVDIDSNYEIGQPEIQIFPDRIAAEQRGVSMVSIGNTIGALMGGKKTGKFTEGGHRFDMRVRLKEGERKSAKDINQLYVRNNRGELVRLSDVVRVVPRLSLLAINRVNRERAISIYAAPAPGFSQQEAVNEAMLIAKSVLPKGYYAELTGTAKTSKESFDSLIFALLVGIIVSYMILASQFNSYMHPFIILLSLPFSFSGAIAALLLTGQTLNIYSFIGLILLMGLVKKNSILLVEFTNKVREEEKKNVFDALLVACPIRLRPIMMTTLSTIAAALPPALALGPGAESRIPMAVAVLGGMAFSTLLTLFVVPCAYSLLSRWERRKFD